MFEFNNMKVEIIDNPSVEKFNDLYENNRKPLIIRGLNIGKCSKLWNLAYLKEKVGDMDVKIHVTTEPNMSFIDKNFLYKSVKFKDFLTRLSDESSKTDFFFNKDELYYLRSLGTNVRKDPADIKKQFPSLAEEIEFPPFFSDDKFFSSVFRISSPNIRLWTHYDIMDNFLMQISGTKKVILFPPTDSPFLYLRGDKSEVLDIETPDLEKYPKFSQATPYECLMEPGDVLFIPALWFHNVISNSLSIAVNVFWKHLPSDLYDKKDPYGNKDLLPASDGFRFLDKALKSFESLPESYRKFYLLRALNMCEDEINKL